MSFDDNFSSGSVIGLACSIIFIVLFLSSGITKEYYYFSVPLKIPDNEATHYTSYRITRNALGHTFNNLLNESIPINSRYINVSIWVYEKPNATINTEYTLSIFYYKEVSKNVYIQLGGYQHIITIKNNGVIQ